MLKKKSWGEKILQIKEISEQYRTSQNSGFGSGKEASTEQFDKEKIRKEAVGHYSENIPRKKIAENWEINQLYRVRHKA